MKSLALILFCIAMMESAFSVCTSPISRTNYSAFSILSSTTLNNDINTVYTRVNELPGDCITDSTITSAKVVDGTLVNADISASAAIARSKLGTPNTVISTSGTTTYTTTSATFVDVTNLTVSITTTGGPVEIFMINADSTNASYVGASRVGGTSAGGQLKLVRGATDVGIYGVQLDGASGTLQTAIPSGAVRFYDTPAAGTYTYKIQGLASSSTLNVYYSKLVAREL